MSGNEIEVGQMARVEPYGSGWVVLHTDKAGVVHKTFYPTEITANAVAVGLNFKPYTLNLIVSIKVGNHNAKDEAICDAIRESMAVIVNGEYFDADVSIHGHS